jgi:WD40 repeat protein
LCVCFGCKKKEGKALEEVNTPPPEEPEAKPVSDKVDLYGDTLPLGAIARLGSLRMVDRSIRQMIFSADGTQAFSTHEEGYQVWKLADGSRDKILKHEAPGQWMATSSDGAYLATNVEGKAEVAVWDLKTGESATTLTTNGELEGLCFMQGHTLITLAGEGGVQSWNVKDEKPKAKTIGASWTQATALGCSAKSGWLAIGTEDGDAYALKADGQAPIKLGTADERINAAAVAPNGSSFAFGSTDENIRVWLKPEATEPQLIKAHKRTVLTLSYSSDSTMLYSTGGDWWFRKWDPLNGEAIEEMPGAAGLDAQLMVVSPDGNLMISWSEHANERGSEAGRWWLWNPINGAMLLEPPRHSHPLQAVRFSPDGKQVVTASEDHSIRLWDVKSSKNTNFLDGGEGPINDVQFSADGTHIYSGGKAAHLRKWNWETDNVDISIQGVGGPLNRFVLSPDERNAYTGDQIGRVWSWDTKSGNKIQALDRQGYSAIYDVDITSDGRLLAIGGSDSVVRVIDLNGGSQVAEITVAGSNANYAVSFSPDNKLLATGGDGHKIQLWNTSDWSQAKVLAGHDGTVRCVRFGPNNKRLVSGGNDEIVRVWDVESGKELATYEGHVNVISDVDVSPDGKTLVSASRDRTALLWEMP